MRIQDRSKACPPYVIRDSKNLSMTAENFSKKKGGGGIKTACFLLKWSIKQQLFERNSHLHFGTIHSVVASPAAAEGPCNHQWSVRDLVDHQYFMVTAHQPSSRLEPIPTKYLPPKFSKPSYVTKLTIFTFPKKPR